MKDATWWAFAVWGGSCAQALADQTVNVISAASSIIRYGCEYSSIKNLEMVKRRVEMFVKQTLMRQWIRESCYHVHWHNAFQPHPSFFLLHHHTFMYCIYSNSSKSSKVPCELSVSVRVFVAFWFLLMRIRDNQPIMLRQQKEQNTDCTQLPQLKTIYCHTLI